MAEINLLESFPKCKRRVEKGWKTEKNKIIAKRFDKDFFDGERINGYGGYYYDGRWRGVVKKLQELYGINSDSSVLDIGCAKGFLLYDLQDMIPGIKIAGIDISNYAINHAMDGFGRYMIKNNYFEKLKEDSLNAKTIEEIARKKILPFMIEGNADNLPWADNSFDVVLSINTAHYLQKKRCSQAIQEMNRVCKHKRYKFIQLDSWISKEEKNRIKDWAAARTIMGENEWLKIFKELRYDGDYYWTIV